MNIPKDKYLKIFECCLPVRGFARSIIYDLNRNDYDFIPNELCDFLQAYNNRCIDWSSFSPEEASTVQEYLVFLLEKQYIFFCEEWETALFPPISKEWDFPGHLLSVIAEIGPTWTAEQQTALLEALQETHCPHLQLYSHVNRPLTFYANFLEKINKSHLRSVELIVPYYEGVEGVLEDFFSRNMRLKNLILYQAPEARAVRIGEMMDQCFMVDQPLQLNTKVDFGYFQVNVSLFTESQHYHTFFHRKAFINGQGEVLRHPEDSQRFGRLGEQSLLQISQQKDFQYYWQAHKEKTDICRQCEFRHMCVDGRVPKRRADDSWYHEEACQYNPFVAKWAGEEGFQYLEDCGIVSDEEGFRQDEEKIVRKLQELYEEG